MIKSNLAIIMAEKKIKISELSRKTGISRVTLKESDQAKIKIK